MKAEVTKWLSRIGRKGGVKTSPAKLAAARANGAKGGRPRKPRNSKTGPAAVESHHNTSQTR
jgi:hypothetical protein